jgi:hypothetical protein
MTRQTSKGTCTFCHRELSKASMTRHLASCEQRKAIQGEIGSRQKAEKIRAFHLIVEGYRLPMYWMHLEVAAGTTLATLDRFLRATWLECCGHLSAFEIAGVRYKSLQHKYNLLERKRTEFKSANNLFTCCILIRAARKQSVPKEV